jgi:hypothetical protein
VSGAVHANLAGLTNQTRRRADEQVFEAFKAGGGGFVPRHPVELRDAACRATGDGVAVTFAQSGASLQATIPALELPRDWQSFGSLRVETANGPQPVTLELAVVGARCRLSRRRRLGESERASVEVDLSDLPLAAGIRPPYEPGAVAFAATWEGGGAGREIIIRDLSLRPARRSPSACADRFGQRRSTNWPGKIRTVRELRASVGPEAETLAAMPLLPDRDKYGGWTTGPTFDATGFFRVDRDSDGRSWLVDPAGNPFWSLGITCVRTSDVTPVAARQHLFERLPSPNGRYAAAYTKDNRGREGLSFYCWNLLRKWGSVEAWRDRVLDRLEKWGINTIACWSDPQLLEQRRMPHVRFARARSRDAAGGPRSFPDVYDPAWAAWLDGRLAELAAPNRDDPWLLGYFIDNESPWRNMRLLAAPPEASLRTRWIEFVGQRFGSLASLNEAWATRFGDWEQVRLMTDDGLPAEGPVRQCLQAFEAEYADRYFGTIERLLRKHDPNHMYLGCRFVRAAPDEGIVRALGRHADVLSVNCYSLHPDRQEFEAWHRMSGDRPILIGEHHFALRSDRQLPPLYRSYTVQERREFYVRFVREWARMPFSVGCHWFQHADQPITGRASNGENQLIGFVDITDQPHPELVTAAREAAERIYPWHAGAQ